MPGRPEHVPVIAVASARHEPVTSGANRTEPSAPGAANASTRFASAISASRSRSRSGPNISMVTVAPSRVRASRHIPATNPSTSTVAGMTPLTV